jgi:DICT domain-containing protein
LAVHQPELDCWIPQVEADARLIAAAPTMSKTLQRAAHVLAELADQSPQLLALRAEIVACIKNATPEYYGEGV